MKNDWFFGNQRESYLKTSRFEPIDAVGGVSGEV